MKIALAYDPITGKVNVLGSSENVVQQTKVIDQTVTVKPQPSSSSTSTSTTTSTSTVRPLPPIG